MTLVLTLKAGEDFYVDDARFVVSEITSPDDASVSRDFDGASFRLVKDADRHEIAPGAFAFIGDRGQFHLIRIGLDAPRTVLIDRGEAYRDAGGHTKRVRA